MKFIKTLIKEYYDDEYDMDVETMPYEDEMVIKQRLNKLPDTLTLYRILKVTSKNDINTKQPGSHYSLDKRNLIQNYNFLRGSNYYLLTVSAPKKLIDLNTTVQNNINFPAEKEITLKNKGLGANVINLEPIG